MDDPADEDDDYSDDDLDALPDNAFHDLQQHAISTQKPSLSAQVQLPTVQHSVGLASGLGRLSVKGSATVARSQAIQTPSSDYGDFDEDMLDGEIFDAAEEPTLAARYEANTHGKEPGEFSQREQWRLQRYGAHQRNPKPAEKQQFVGRQGAIGVPPYDDNDVGHMIDEIQRGEVTYLAKEDRAGPPPQEGVDVNVLQAQVQKVSPSKVPSHEIASLCFYSAASRT